MNKRYKPSIDGLRALAVLAVIGFHAYPSIFKGGFVGVDIFFVISGYLITTIIIDDLRSGQFSVINFYSKRIRRIFPALSLVMIACYLLGWQVLMVDEYRQLNKHLLAGATFVSNFILMNESGYFDTAAEIKPLLHLWSLAIEEQFYILFPLVLYLTWQRTRAMIIFISLLIAGSFFINLYLGLTSKDITAFYFILSRIWEILLGSLLAVTPAKRLLWLASARHWRMCQIQVLPALGLFALAGSVFFIDPTRHPMALWMLLPCTGAVVVLISVQDPTLADNNILSSRLLVWIGTISYPLYLWHWPLLTFANIIEGERGSVWQRAILIALSFVLAWLTHITVERFFRFGGKAKLKTALLIALMFVIICLSSLTYQREGLSDRSFTQRYRAISAALDDWAPTKDLFSTTYFGVNVFTTNVEREPNILFIGDSHMEQFGPAIANLSPASLAPAIMITGGGCPPIPGVVESSLTQCHQVQKDIQTILKESKTIRTIVLGGCWNCYFIHETYALNNTASKFRYYFNQSGISEPFRQGRGAELALASFASYIKELSTHYAVYVILDNPLGSNYNPRGMIKNRLFIEKEGSDDRVAALDVTQANLNEDLKIMVTGAGGHVIDQLSVLCEYGRCLRKDQNNQPIYKDDHHMRPFFVKTLSKYFSSLPSP